MYRRAVHLRICPDGGPVKALLLQANPHNYDAKRNLPFLISATADGIIRIWSINKQKCLCSLMGHEDSVQCLKLHTQKNCLISGSKDGTLRIWSLNGAVQPNVDDKIGREPERKNSRVLGRHSTWIETLDISSDGQFLVSGSSDGEIRVWDLFREKLIESITEHDADVYALSFIPDRPEFISVSGDNTAKIHTLIFEPHLSLRRQKNVMTYACLLPCESILSPAILRRPMLINANPAR